MKMREEMSSRSPLRFGFGSGSGLGLGLGLGLGVTIHAFHEALGRNGRASLDLGRRAQAQA
eukprot:CAMPEP_0118857980 /NCGR_PEP_ID=MMETSP1163-20130328/4854_1 /TAXON_ID=124430 /ORGANISM="Phaeomonas parva, Strain CCMP2877" /LENGTH=60 /DNA_ID=CAMNT_0006791375 /DNA_START=50 /DNA_END=232 /DNA_ORIENTATION=+